MTMQSVEEEGTADRETVPAPTDEWTAATLAHASVTLTTILGMAGGVGALIGPLVPLVMYLGYRERSRFVAFHALQSFVYQVVGVLAYVALVAVLVVWMALAWTVSGLLSVVGIGLLLMPLDALLTVLTGVILAGAPLAWVGYGLYAAYQVYQGSDFRYALIGEWMEREVKL